MRLALRTSLILLLAALAAVLAGCSTETNRVALREQVGDARVVLLSTEWCGYCRKLRGDLSRWGIEYTELDVETTDEGKNAYHLVGGRGVPILLVDSEVVHGYAPKRARELIATAGLGAAPP